MSLKTLSWRAGLRGSDSDHSAPVSKELWGEKEKAEAPRGCVGRSWCEFVRTVGVGGDQGQAGPEGLPACVCFFLRRAFLWP